MTKKSDTHSNTYSTSSNPNRYIVDSWLVLVGLRKNFLRNLCIEHVLRIEQFDFFYHCSFFTMLYLLSTRYVPFFWFVVYSATYCYATFPPEEANCKHCFLGFASLHPFIPRQLVVRHLAEVLSPGQASVEFLSRRSRHLSIAMINSVTKSNLGQKSLFPFTDVVY